MFARRWILVGLAVLAAVAVSWLWSRSGREPGGSPEADGESPPTANIRGEVVAWDGEPVVGATVFLRSPMDPPPSPYVVILLDALVPPVRVAESRTDGEGRFELTAPRDGDWEVVVTASGYAAANAHVRTKNTRCRINLRPGAELAGRARAANGEPLAGATVWSESGGGCDRFLLCVRTERDGRFRFPSLEPGEGLVAVCAEGYPLWSGEVEIGHTPWLEIAVGGNATLLGTLVGTTGQVVSDATIRFRIRRDEGILAARARTDADGAFRVEHLPTGPVTGFEGSKAGGASFWADADGPPPILRSGEEVRGRFVMPTEAVWIGRVTDADTGAPLPAATVYEEIDGRIDDPVAIADAEGRFRVVMADSANNFWVGIGGPSPACAAETFVVRRPAGKAEFRHDVRVRRSAWIEGRLDGGGVPVSHARLTNWFLPFTSAPIDPEGCFRIRVPPGNMALDVCAEGFIETKIKIDGLRPGEVRRGIVVSLDAGVILRGRVVGPEGAPIKKARVTAASGDFRGEYMGYCVKSALRNGRAAWTDETGTFRLTDNYGKSACLVEAPGYLPLYRIVDLQRAQEFRLARGHLLTGRAVDENGRPVPGAAVRYRREVIKSDLVPDARTDAEGRFRLRLPSRQETCFTVWAPGRLDAIGFVEAPADIEVVLPRSGTLEGLIRAPDGSPAPEVSVRASDGENWDEEETNKHGWFRIQGFLPGPIEVSVRPETDGWKPVTLRVDSRECGMLEIDLRAEK